MRLSHQAVLTVASKTTKHIGVFILSMVLTRYLTKDTYGTYLQVQLIANTTIYLSILGIPHSVYYFLPKVKDKKRFVRITTLMMLTIAFTAAIIVYLSTKRLSGFFNNPDIYQFSLIIGSFILFQIPIKIFEPLMLTTNKVMVFVKINATYNIVYLFVILIPVIMQKSLNIIFNGLVIFYIIQFINILIIIQICDLGTERKVGNEIPYSFKKQMGYSIPIGISGVLGEISREIDKIIIGRYFLPADYAIYTRGAMEIPLVNVAQNAISNILMPKFVSSLHEGDINSVINLWKSSTRMMAFFMYPVFIFFMFTADIVIPLLFSEQYIESTIIFRIYLIGLVSRITAYDAIVRAIGKTGYLLKITIFALVFNCTTSVILVKMVGRIGPPIATIITVYIVRLLYIKIISKLLNENIIHIFPWKSLSLLLTCATFAIIPSYFMRYITDIKLATLILVFLPFIYLYISSVKKINVLEKTEIEALRGILPRKLRWIL